MLTMSHSVPATPLQREGADAASHNQAAGARMQPQQQPQPQSHQPQGQISYDNLSYSLPTTPALYDSKGAQQRMGTPGAGVMPSPPASLATLALRQQMHAEQGRLGHLTQNIQQLAQQPQQFGAPLPPLPRASPNMAMNGAAGGRPPMPPMPPAAASTFLPPPKHPQPQSQQQFQPPQPSPQPFQPPQPAPITAGKQQLPYPQPQPPQQQQSQSQQPQQPQQLLAVPLSMQPQAPPTNGMSGFFPASPEHGPIQNLNDSFASVASNPHSAAPSPSSSPFAPDHTATAAAPAHAAAGGSTKPRSISISNEFSISSPNRSPSSSLSDAHLYSSRGNSRGHSRNGSIGNSGDRGGGGGGGGYGSSSRSRSASVMDVASLAGLLSPDQKDSLLESQARELDRSNDDLRRAAEYGEDLMAQVEALQSDKADLQEQLQMANIAFAKAQAQANNASGSNASGGGADHIDGAPDLALLASLEAFSAFVRVELTQAKAPVTNDAATDLASFQRVLRSQRRAVREAMGKAERKEEESSRLILAQKAQLNSFAQSQTQWTLLQARCTALQQAHDEVEIHAMELQTKLRIQASQAQTTGLVSSQQMEAARDEWAQETRRAQEAAKAENKKLRAAIRTLKKQLQAKTVTKPITQIAPLQHPDSELEEDVNDENANGDFSIVVTPAAGGGGATKRGRSNSTATSTSLADDLATAESSPRMGPQRSPGQSLSQSGSSPMSLFSRSSPAPLMTMPTVSESSSGSPLLREAIITPGGGTDPVSPIGASVDDSVATATTAASGTPSTQASSSQVEDEKDEEEDVDDEEEEGEDEAPETMTKAPANRAEDVSSLASSLSSLAAQLSSAREAAQSWSAQASAELGAELERQKRRDEWHAAEHLWFFERARAREVEEQATALRLEELVRERNLQAEVTQGRAHEAALEESRALLRQVRDAKDAAHEALVAELRDRATQLANKDAELLEARTALEEATKAAAQSATAAAVANALMHSSAASVAGSTTTSPKQPSRAILPNNQDGALLLSTPAHMPEKWAPPPHYQSPSKQQQPPHQQPQQPPQQHFQQQPQQLPPPVFAPAAAAPSSVAAASSASSSAASSSSSAPAASSSSSALVSSGGTISDVLSAIRIEKRSTRSLLCFLALLQLLFTACWFLLTNGGGSALADHPFVQRFVRWMFNEDARAFVLS